MIRFERTFDYALVREVLTHPAIFAHITDDDSPAREEWHPPAHLLYVAAREADQVLGLFVLAPQSAVCWEIHVAMLPEAWGRRSAEAARAMLAWVWTHTPCRRLVCAIRSENRLALRYARQAGLTQYGLNPRSWLRHGRLCDQVLLGISKDE